MTNGQKIVDLAKKQIGITEIPPNSNQTKFNAWMGIPAAPWCAMFVSWCYANAGFPLGNIGYPKGFAGCQTAVAHFRKTGEITTTPQAGDIVFFDWNGDGRFDHVGIFVGGGATVVFDTIEGNTSLKNDSNGGQVMFRTRNSKTSHVFVHPKVLG